MTRPRLFALVLLVLPACGGGGGGGPADAGADAACAAPAISDLVAVENPANVLSLFIEWQTDVAAAGEVTVDCGADYTETFAEPAAATDHAVFAMGLVAGAECEITVTALAGGCTSEEQTAITVGALPDFVPDFTVVEGTGTPDPGWTILNLNGLFAQPPFLVVLVDEQGRVRWYHRRSTTRPSGSTDVRIVPGGVLIAGSPQVPAALVSWRGDVVWEADLAAHHEMLPLGDDEYYYLLGHRDCADGFLSDSVIRWRQPDDEERWEWRLCDHYVPSEPRDDWSHINTVEPFPGEDALLLSPRDQNNLVKVDLGDDSLVWVLGAGGDFAMDPADEFLRQHAPEVLDSGNILVFDNGLETVREYSRAIEIAYDEGAMTAEVVWEYRLDPDIFTPIWGDVDRLPSGHTLVTFGSNDPQRRSRIVEVDAAGEEVWQLVFDLQWGVYRSERVTDLPLLGETP